MPFRTLRLKPGVTLEQSLTLNQFQLSASNLIRFYGSLVQKLGGWAAVTTQTFVGTCRGLHGWADITGNAYMAIGTDQRLQVLASGVISDITPVVETDNPGVAFSTTSGQSAVSIGDGAYSPNAGDWIYLATQVSVGGLVLLGYYRAISSQSGIFTVTAAANATSTVTAAGQVPIYTTTNSSGIVSVNLPNHGLATGNTFDAVVSTTVATLIISGLYPVTVVDANHFTISVTGTANAATMASMNGGDAQIRYLLPSGKNVATAVVGWGLGQWGAGGWGTGASGQLLAPGRQWSLGHWGQYLIASPSNGGIYYWNPPTIAPAQVISDTAPLYNISVIIMNQAQIIISLGAEVGGTLQPLLVRWCDAGDFTDWTTSATNQAGSFLLPQGSTLVGGLVTGLGALIWTDTDLWSITYLGFPLVFGFNIVAANCGLVAQRAVGVEATLIMWLGTHQFYQASTGGGVTPVECSVWDFYFYNVDFSQLAQIFCAVNTVFTEMTWFFPLSSTSPLYSALAPMGYVKYNYTEQVWDYGLSSQYQRTAWAGLSPLGNPVGADLNGLLQQHEIGFDADGQAMLWSWQTGFFELDEAADFQFSDFLIPDFVTIGSPDFIPTLQTTDYPNQSPTQVVTQMVNTGSTYFITYSARGRFMSIGFAGPGSDVGTFSRLGAVRLRVARDGQN